ncbi:UDP-3-O-acylglucosamine N-acyltransferase [Roseivivax sp. THAF40]|uniref:UDP-3-O-(3-hydroxymyristoyl)glucosamine N-acyltransferase n=1 Tax=unclassified Roseivivax TaxID=2639302 RepID=UPI00126953AC|nr:MULTISPECIES: UDP-3-O-(3-hydroxymyristoyl)glucosamine N-acyltransferase [unclassified Roseivivax]QFS82250.1 UDP-3-O-acylglucosamine N-acyltransferase [Roseivivax sp. THAF197b]QFT46050.1 UDP-3-O-acylglucosamine N-acyltransferase [Roseivivax sp. THAF40]
MRHTIDEIAHALGLKAVGDGAIAVEGVAEPADCPPDRLAIALKPAFAEQLGQGEAQAALLWDGADWQGMGLKAAILAKRPRYALSGVSAAFDPGQGYGAGIHETAHIDPSARIAPDVAVGPFTVIGAEVEIGTGSVIGPQVFIGRGARIGAGALVHAGARIGAGVTAGDRLIVQFNAVIGSDGFSFVTPEVSGVERARESLGDQGAAEAQPWARIHSLGAVTLGDDVEVGANSSIDRGTVRDTGIGTGTKIDNNVQVGHNVVVGQHCLLCGMVGIGGSTVIGDHSVLGGQSGVGDNLKIGARVILGAGTLALSNVPEGRVMMGYPAMKMDQNIEAYKGLRRLPRLFREVDALRKAVSKLSGNG